MAPIVGQNGVQISLELFNYSGNTNGERARNFSATPQIGLQPVKLFLLISEKDGRAFAATREIFLPRTRSSLRNERSEKPRSFQFLRPLRKSFQGIECYRNPRQKSIDESTRDRAIRSCGCTRGCAHAVPQSCAGKGRRIGITVGGEATRGSAFYIIGQSRRVTTLWRAGCVSLLKMYILRSAVKNLATIGRIRLGA